MNLAFALNCFIFIIFVNKILFVYGQYKINEKCDENSVNNHMLKCYKEHIHSNLDETSTENQYYFDGKILCSAYNQSSSYRKCLYKIFARNQICSYEKYPFTFEYAKIFWKLILSSCLLEQNDNCSPSNLNKQILNKCHYSFDEKFPTKCREFLRSLKCLDRHDIDLIRFRSDSICSRNQGYHQFYQDLGQRLLLAIDYCEY